MKNAAIKFRVTWRVYSVFSGSLKSSWIIMVCPAAELIHKGRLREPGVCSTLLYTPDLQHFVLVYSTWNIPLTLYGRK